MLYPWSPRADFCLTWQRWSHTLPGWSTPLPGLILDFARVESNFARVESDFARVKSDSTVWTLELVELINFRKDDYSLPVNLPY